MGAWGIGSFENDDALDWVGGIEGFDGLSMVRAKLKQVADQEAYLEAPDACQAIAAAEVVAAVAGQPCASPPEAVVQMIEVQVTILQADRDLARQALDRVLGESSELAELWAESDESDAWKAAMAELRGRL
jgi:hypothetical protein